MSDYLTFPIVSFILILNNESNSNFLLIIIPNPLYRNRDHHVIHSVFCLFPLATENRVGDQAGGFFVDGAMLWIYEKRVRADRGLGLSTIVIFQYGDPILIISLIRWRKIQRYTSTGSSLLIRATPWSYISRQTTHSTLYRKSQRICFCG